MLKATMKSILERCYWLYMLPFGYSRLSTFYEDRGR